MAAAVPPAIAQSAAAASSETATVSPVQKQVDTMIELSTGIDFTSGKYGLNSRTDEYTENLTGKYGYGDWTGEIYVPFETVTSPGGLVMVNGRPVLSAGATDARAILQELGLTAAQYKALTVAQRKALINSLAKRQRDSGIGDVELVGEYDAYNDKASGWEVSLTGTIKLGTASASDGLGTGRSDYALGADVSRRIGDFTLEISFGYRLVGKPADSDLRNYFYGTAGIGYSLAGNTDVTATFSTTECSTSSTGPDNEVSLGVNRQFSRSWEVEIHGIAGLTDAAPTFGLGASVHYSF
jgi:Putative MetA-pathway of phenol degradation